MNLGSLIDRMIAAGMSPGDAGSVAAEIYAAGVASVDPRSSNAIRQQRFRDRNAAKDRNESVTNRNECNVTETVTNRNEALRNNADAVSPIDTTIKKGKRQNSERASRGTRIDPDWKPSAGEEQFAIDEGFSHVEITREASRFRDYWKGRAGAGGVKLDWKATWQNWIRTSGDKLGKTPKTPGNGGEGVGSGFYAAFGSPEQDAWDRYGQEHRGKSFPRDKAGGWRHPARWPPGYVPQPQAKIEAPATPALRTMQ